MNKISIQNTEFYLALMELRTCENRGKHFLFKCQLRRYISTNVRSSLKPRSVSSLQEICKALSFARKTNINGSSFIRKSFNVPVCPTEFIYISLFRFHLWPVFLTFVSIAALAAH